MNRFLRSVTSALIAATFAFSPGAFAENEEEIIKSDQEKDIIQIIALSDDFSTIIELLLSSDLIGTLKGKGEYTIFIPTDNAFKIYGISETEELKYDKAKLQKILQFHVVKGKHTLEDLKAKKKLKTLKGQEMILIVEEDGNHSVNGAKIIIPNIDAKNGKIHVINKVMVPKE